ncbi:MAG: hypothetical protein ABIQ73_28340 [Acidimicrobiales bacterium]
MTFRWFKTFKAGPFRGCKTSPTSRPREGWLYLASVLDLGSRRLLGYSMHSISA